MKRGFHEARLNSSVFPPTKRKRLSSPTANPCSHTSSHLSKTRSAENSPEIIPPAMQQLHSAHTALHASGTDSNEHRIARQACTTSNDSAESKENHHFTEAKIAKPTSNKPIQTSSEQNSVTQQDNARTTPGNTEANQGEVANVTSRTNSEHKAHSPQNALTSQSKLLSTHSKRLHPKSNPTSTERGVSLPAKGKCFNQTKKQTNSHKTEGERNTKTPQPKRKCCVKGCENDASIRNYESLKVSKPDIKENWTLRKVCSRHYYEEMIQRKKLKKHEGAPRTSSWRKMHGHKIRFFPIHHQNRPSLQPSPPGNWSTPYKPAFLMPQRIPVQQVVHYPHQQSHEACPHPNYGRVMQPIPDSHLPSPSHDSRSIPYMILSHEQHAPPYQPYAENWSQTSSKQKERENFLPSVQELKRQAGISDRIEPRT